MSAPHLFNVAALAAGSGSAFTDEAAAYFAAAGPLSGSQKSAIDTLTRTLIANGDWLKFSRLWLLANETDDAGIICLKTLESMTPFPGVAPTDLLFEPSLGFSSAGAGDFGSKGRLLTNFQPADDALLLDDSGHVGVYLTSSRTVGDDTVAVYGHESGQEIGIFPGRAAASPARLDFRFNGGALYGGPTVDDVAGHSICGVRASGPTFFASKNGAAPTTGAATIVGRPTISGGGVGVLAANPFGAPSNDRVGVLHFGAELSNAEIARIATAINTYMMAIGSNVY